MWTPSYVFYVGGWSILMLAFFIYFIDIKGKEKFFFPFKALGLNPLFAFVMAGIITKTLARVIHWNTVVINDDGTTKEVMNNAYTWLYQNGPASLLGHNEWASLLFALCYVAIFTGMAIFLYKKKIIIKL